MGFARFFIRQLQPQHFPVSIYPGLFALKEQYPIQRALGKGAEIIRPVGYLYALSLHAEYEGMCAGDVPRPYGMVADMILFAEPPALASVIRDICELFAADSRDYLPQLL